MPASYALSRPVRTPLLHRGLALALFGLLATANTAQAKDHITLGAGVIATPRYEGSDEYKGRTIPIINARIGRFYARTEDGVGLSLIQSENLALEAGANMMWGYGGDDVPPGIGGLSDAIGARLGLSANFSGAIFSIAATQAVTHRDRGLLIKSRVAYPYAATDRLMLTPSVTANWANEKYMNGYFGVNSTQSSRSGLAQYHPTSGLKDVSLRLTAGYAVTKRLKVSTGVATSRLVGDAADSPIVKQKTQFETLLGGSYSF
ncbi:MipA/OmpV family protein [Castellaniella sp.]|uniref:MipA/OmpV family protein n=1 Tax=Castellaniella sp. TaxID=1955812 RepID=UPI002AFFC5BB|nr:MipA/OmpV family protein [Castellaniella sp.]